MNALERREKIIELLKVQESPLSGNELAKYFNVTRQVIVQDIAILRAAGQEIIATARGYMLKYASPFLTKKIAVRHSEKLTQEELTIFIECGCKVLDVIVEHPLYGELNGMLMLSDSSDVKNFINSMKIHEAVLLSKLTNGIHLHTVEAINNDCIRKAEELLRKRGFLLE